MTRAALAVILAAGVLALYLLRLDPAAGLYVDDAWYIVLAKAIAQGEGTRLISSATTPILPAFPPGFPMLLAPVVALFPDFPGNVVALKAVSILAMFGVAIASYVYLVRYHAAPVTVAVVVALITILMPAFVFLATSSIMAEATFTLGQLLVALAVERATRAPGAQTDRAAAIAGVIGGATLLVRLAGIAGIAASMAYIWKRRGRRAALVFAAVAAVCYAPWLIYSMANRDAVQERLTHGGSIAYGYSELLLMRHGGEPGSGRITWSEIPGRIGFNLANVFGRDVGAQLFPAAYRGAAESGQEVFVLSGERELRATSMGSSTAIVWVSSLLSLVALIGYIAIARRNSTVAEWIVPCTVAMVVLVPAHSFRYVLPLAPFIVFYFFSGVESIVATMRGAREWQFGSLFRIASACIVLLYVFEHGQYLWAARHGEAHWIRDYEEVKAVTDWMRANLVAEGPVATSNPGLVWLATGRKTVALMNPSTHWKEWQERGIRYAAVLHVAEKPASWLGYRVLFESPRLKLWVIDIPPGLTENASDR